MSGAKADKGPWWMIGWRHLSRNTRRTVLTASALACLVGVTGRASGQLPDVRGYYLHVASGSFENALESARVGDVQRLRGMVTPRIGLLDLDLAYEHALQYTSARATRGLVAGVGGPLGGTEWLDLQGVIEESDHVRWTHRVDRLALTLSSSDVVEVTAGRQTISWATTLLLTPADPFVPFDPAEPFRAYRAGVDAVRVRGFAGGFTEIEVVLRPSDTPAGETLTTVARGRSVIHGVEVAAWAGRVHDEATVGLGATLTVAGAAVRGEGVIRRSDNETIVRLAVGVDRRFPLAGRDLYLVVEYQRDGFGAVGAGDLVPVVLSRPFARREMQVLGRDTFAVQGSYFVHPLIQASLLTLTNVNDPSLLGVPAVSYSAGDEVTIRGGIFFGLGDDVDARGVPGSEYGTVPTTAYLSATVFF